jgi:hypothetical protein
MSQIKRSRLQRGARLLSLVLGWGVSNAAFALAGIFQGTLVPPPIGAGPSGGGGGSAQVPFDAALTMASRTVPVLSIFSEVQASLLTVPVGKYVFLLEIVGIAILASFLIESGTRALVSFLLSYTLSILIVYVVLILPGLVGPFHGDPNALITLGIILTFLVFFPVPLFISLVGTLIGVMLSEKFS